MILFIDHFHPASDHDWSWMIINDHDTNKQRMPKKVHHQTHKTRKYAPPINWRFSPFRINRSPEIYEPLQWSWSYTDHDHDQKTWKSQELVIDHNWSYSHLLCWYFFNINLRPSYHLLGGGWSHRDLDQIMKKLGLQPETPGRFDPCSKSWAWS